ncbi:MAG: carbohydrate kinase family protein [Streptosporangiales bacterium]|nr:carbohydrate kinase family protein [Streptosporangiales bacterium]
MRTVVTGSIATDYLMVFPGRFSELFIADKLDSVSLSFLVDELHLRPGGTAANIAFGLARFGLRPLLVGAVGGDFAEYRDWLERGGVDTTWVHVSSTRHTSRFLCTTDAVDNQIASFYAGAMEEARQIALVPIVRELGGVDVVLISPNDPLAMVRHTEECRANRYPFAADPGQQLARMEGDRIRHLVDHATYLFTNEYERELLLQKTGWTDTQVLGRVGTWITTYGAKGVGIESREAARVHVDPTPAGDTADPTGVGDSFRAGFFAGVGWGLDLERAAQVGCVLATLTLEAVGPQEYDLDPGVFVRRFEETYGPAAAAEVENRVGRPHADIVRPDVEGP